jgi:hypothetical protein
MQNREKVHAAFQEWYEDLPKRHAGVLPAKGSIAGALVVIERLKKNFDLSIDSHTAKGGSQISGASGAAVRLILERFGESRAFLEEGGRTNRGLRGDIAKLLAAIASSNLESLSTPQRNKILTELQQLLVGKVREFHELERLQINYDASRTTWQAVSDWLDKARESGKEGPVSQYLVGAKLQLRFPKIEISNESFSTADVQLGRHGDFYFGNTVFHVTVSPSPALYDKCKRNLNDGLRVYVLVRNRDVVGTKQNAENTAAGQIVVESVETFVSQNLDELSSFSEDQRRERFLLLLEIYNRRVEAADINKSLLVEIPPNLR